MFLKLAFTKRPLVSGETPEMLLECVRNRDAFLFQSGNGGRFSFIGYDPFAKVWSRGGVTQLLNMRDFSDWKKSGSVKIFDRPPLEVLRELLSHFRFNGTSPVPFPGGAAGFFSYDFGVRLSGINQKVFDDLELPDFSFFFVDRFFAVDHEKSELYGIALAPTDAEAKRSAAAMANDLKSSFRAQSVFKSGKIVSNLTYHQYEKKILRIKKFLEQGDTYQVNFSQRFSADFSGDPWGAYKKFTGVNPAPYSVFFDFGDFQVLSSSPELLLEKRGSKVLTKPIKGTVPRGRTSIEDETNIRQLLASEKDEAELSMIVDLERNDLGKVCDPGSVRVVHHREVEKYARVIHTVSTVEGNLLHNKDFFDAFAALFPGGSITGCPKKRTMEIIDELEDFARGVYTGSAGFIGFNGDGAMNILIRTALIREQKLYYQAGGGIVMDSDPAKEYEESFHKGLAFREVLEKS